MIELFRSRKMVGLTITLIAICIVIIILEGLWTVDEPKPSPSQDGQLISKNNHDSFDGNTGTTKSKRPVQPSNGTGDFLSEKVLTERLGCWETEQFDVRKPCARCSDFEIKSRHLSACEATGYKEEIYCHKSGLTLKSCDMSSWHFWRFELWMVVMSFLSCYVTHCREKQLQDRMVAKINKQIASGV